MRADTLTPLLSAAPGEAVTWRLRIENDGDRPTGYRLRVVGLDDANVIVPQPNGRLAAGDVVDVDLQLLIPDPFAPGRHALGVEIISDRPGEAHAIAGVTVAVGSPERLVLTVDPSTVRGRRRGTFWIDVVNRDSESLELDLTGEGPDLDITATPQRVLVPAGQRARARARVRGPRHLFGEPLQHPFSVSARSRSAPAYAPATFIQRPVFPRPLRTVVAVLTVLALWAGALAIGLRWWSNRNAKPAVAPAAELVDTDGDGVPDTPGDQLVDTDGDGVPDTTAADVAAAVAAGEGTAPSKSKKQTPTHTVVNGTVKAGETGQNDGVLVTLTPIALGTPPPPAASFFGASRPVGKLWPARAAQHRTPGSLVSRRTETVTSASSGADGAFLFGDVLIRQNYEVNFAKAGFDSQSFVVTPTDDGKPVKLEVVLDPSTGALGGVVRGPGGPLGNVDIVATDGTLLFNTTTSTQQGQVGTWSLSAVNTPATFTITATLRGYGTEVVQVPLDPGERRTDIAITMTPGVGSISGHITAAGQPLGGATLTASNGDVTRTTTSLTEGDLGLYHFPQLEIPGDFTVTAAAEGYITQTRLVSLSGNAQGVDFDLVKTTAAITGVVFSDATGPLPGAAVTISKDDLTFTASTAAVPEPGAFTVDDLPPGTYLVKFARFDHAEQSQLVTLAAGETKDLGRITLHFTGVAPPPTTGSVSVRVVDSLGADLTGATVTLTDVGTGRQLAQLSDAAGVQATFVFQNVPVGTYTVLVTRPRYREGFQRVSVGLGPQSVVVPLFLLGQA